MKRCIWMILVLVLLMTVWTGIAETAYPSNTGALCVTGSALTDAEGNSVQLRGLSTHGLAWYPQYVNQKFFTQLHEDFGVNAVRLALYTDENGGYCAGGDRTKLKQLVIDGINYAREADLYVIVDWHILREKTPNRFADDAEEFLNEISGMFAEDTHILYEICNEPNGGTTWAQISVYANRVIPVIRANDPDAVILVGTPDWCQQITAPVNAPLPYDNIMYDLHFYAATHGQFLRDRMIKALDAGLPVFVSEYGLCAADANGKYDFDQANIWADLMDERGVSYMMWAISNKGEKTSIFRHNIVKSFNFARKDLTDGGLWLVDRLGGPLE